MRKKYEQYMVLIYDNGRKKKVVKSKFWLQKTGAIK